MLTLGNKYRPKSWEDITEQNSIITILNRQIETGNIKNSYMFTGKSGGGKAQPLTSKIFTPYGYTNMGSLNIGDTILDGEGNPTKILGIFPQGKRPIYKIKFTDGSFIEVSDNHINSVWRWRWKGTEKYKEYLDLTTKNLIELLKHSETCIQVDTPLIDCWEDNDISIDPYLLGCLIGDGSLHDNFSFSNKDKDILDRVDNILNKDWGLKLVPIETTDCDFKISYKTYKNLYLISYKGILYDGFESLRKALVKEGYPPFDNAVLRKIANKVSGMTTLRHYPELENSLIIQLNPYKIDHGNGNGKGISKLYAEIKKLGLNVKFDSKRIPQNYIYSSINSRLKLLHGLMDTDGTFEKGGQAYFTTGSKLLAEDVALLCRSLGMTAKIISHTPKYHYIYKNIDEYRDGAVSYNVIIRSTKYPLFYCERKLKKYLNNVNNRKTDFRPLRSIQSIEYDRDDECQCIFVESPLHTYLTDNITVTHNTTCARIFANKLGSTPIEIDAASNSGVDNIRLIIEDAQERSISSKYKVFILDEAHMLSNAAWNAILKTIEEPPKYTIFIFCTTDPQKIPATILNRVQRYNFTTISISGIFKRLKYVCEQENYQYEESALDYIAKLSSGSMREALSLLGQIADYSTNINMDNVITVLGNYSYTYFFQLANALLDGDEKKVLSIINQYFNEGRDLKLFVDQYMNFNLDVIKYSLFKNCSLLNIPSNLQKDLENIINFDDPNKYYNYVVDKLLSLKNMIKYDTNIKSTIEIVMLQIARCQ